MNGWAPDSKGAFGWPGAFGTWWQADPEKNMIMIFLIQNYTPLTSDAVQAAARSPAQGSRGPSSRKSCMGR